MVRGHRRRRKRHAPSPAVVLLRPRPRALRTALLVSTALIAATVPAAAQNWTGNTNTDWFTATNWSTGVVPTNADQPTIDTLNNAPVIDGGVAPGVAPAASSFQQIFIGNDATGALTIQNAGTLNADNAFIGNNAGSNGTVTMNGNSIWNSTGTSSGTIIGFNGTGSFNVNSGTVNTANTILGFGAGSSGTVTVDGAGSIWKQTGGAPTSALFVGYSGTGWFTAQSGGQVQAVNTYVGHLAGSTGTATVTGAGSSWTGNGFFIGNGGNGTFNVLSGGTLTANANSFIGYSAGSTGTLNVDGAGSKFSLLNNSLFFVGGSGLSGAPSGTGVVNVTNGGELDMNGSVTFLGVSSGAGTMNFDDGKWNPGSAVEVGFSGTGTVNISNGSNVQLNGQIIVGDCTCATGTVTVTGAGSQFSSIANLDVLIGNGGKGTFNVLNGGSASFLSNVVLGHDSGSSGTVNVQSGSSFTTNTNNLTVGLNGLGTVNVDGAGSQLTTTGLFVGNNHGTGIVNITNGGVVNASGVVGLGNNHSDAFGTVTVSGAGSQFNSTDITSGDIAIGVDGTGVFNVLNGATASFATDLFLGFGAGSGTVNVQSGGHFTTTGNLIVGLNGTGAVNVTGGGSQLNVGGGIFIGEDGTGTVNVTNGASATITGGAFLGDCFCALGTVIVSGAGSTWTSAGATIGGLGTGQFNVLNGASATLGDIFVGTSFGTGTLKVDATSQVNGTSYTQGANGTFNVGISPTGNGKVTVTGTIDLTNGGGGSGALIVDAKTTLAKTYTIMTAPGGVTGPFNSVSVVGNANNLQVIYNATSVVLTVDTFSVANNLPSGLSGNPKHVADALDKAIASGITIPDAFFNVFALSGDSLVNALSQLSGESAAGAQQSNIQLMNSFLSLMLDPFSGAPSGNPGAIGFAREFGAGDKITPEATAAYAAVTPKDRRGDSFAGRWSVWGQAYGGYNKINGDPNTVSHDSAARTYGLTTGFDYRASPDTMIGFALAGAGENWGLADGLGSGRGDAFQLGAYGSRQFGAAYLAGALSYAVHNITTDRTVTVAGADHLTANFTAQSVGGRLETGYHLLTPYFGLTPYAAAQVQDFFTPNYNENATSGSNTFALSYNARSSVSTRTELGTWVDKLLPLDQGNALSLRMRAAWANDHSNNQGINAAFQTLPGAVFTVNGGAPSTNLALLTAGAELRLANNVSIGAKFYGEFGNVSQTYAGTGTVRYTW